MPLRLNFRVEDRGGVMVLISQPTPGADEIVRPASSAEVDLWNALTKRFASPARESYIRVNEQDLVTALMERDHLRRQCLELQKRLDDFRARHPANPPPSGTDGQQREPHEAADERGSPGGEPTTGA